jgi:hypothetical protein
MTSLSQSEHAESNDSPSDTTSGLDLPKQDISRFAPQDTFVEYMAPLTVLALLFDTKLC